MVRYCGRWGQVEEGRELELSWREAPVTEKLLNNQRKRVGSGRRIENQLNPVQYVYI